MGFDANKSDEKVFKEIKLYTGLHNMKIIAINPTKKGLEKIGYKPQNDPVYATVEEQVKKLRLDFHLVGEAPDEERILTKAVFFIENQHRVNRDGTKSEWINDFGRTAWSETGKPEEKPTNYTWFKHETARQAYVGEADLHLFLINWLNIGPDDEAKLDNFDALFEEDYTELKGYLKANVDNEVRVLLTVRDGKYQSAYNKYFDRASNKRTNYWSKYIENQTVNGYGVKEDYQNSFKFQEWVEPEIVPDKGETAASEKAQDDPF